MTVIAGVIGFLVGFPLGAIALSWKISQLERERLRR